jgi:hypothetical protein
VQQKAACTVAVMPVKLLSPQSNRVGHNRSQLPQAPFSLPPSVVTTWQPSTAYMGHRHALTALCWTLPCCQLDTMTVHAPQPPSPHPSFVPVSPCSAQQQANTRGVGGSMCDCCGVQPCSCMRGASEVSRSQQQ